MFRCNLGCYDSVGGANDWLAIIEDCPEAGLKAIDFRRKHSLPDAPTNKINMPGYVWYDEEFVRLFERFANDEANLDVYGTETQAGYQRIACVTNEKIYFSSRRMGSRTGDYLYLSPPIIRDYIKEQTPETARALFADLHRAPIRSLAKVANTLYKLDSEIGRVLALTNIYENDSDAVAEACAIIDALKEGVYL